MRSRLMLVLATVLGLSFTRVMPVTSARAVDSCSPAKTAMQPGTTDHSLMSGGLQRTYVLHIPPGYDPTQRTPLVFSLHGFASNSVQQMFFSRWNEEADQYGFIAAFPQGTGSPPRWNAGVLGTLAGNSADDVQFMRDLFAELSTNLCIDPARIYVNGLSNGGGMTNLLACEVADRIAAVGTVAGAYNSIPGGCKPARPISVIAFHGTADPLVDYQGNRRMGLPSITAWAREWAVRDGCDLKPETIPATGDASGIHYQNCRGNADVILYTIDGGGHTWPGGRPIPFVGKTSTDISATDVMWKFYQAHPLTISS